MTSHLKQDDPDGTTVTPRRTRVCLSFPEQPVTASANDNDCEGPWPLVPFPEGRLGIPSGQSESNQPLSTESACPSLAHEEATIPRAVQNRLSFFMESDVG